MSEKVGRSLKCLNQEQRIERLVVYRADTLFFYIEMFPNYGSEPGTWDGCSVG
jgi:hypothetical protein